MQGQSYSARFKSALRLVYLSYGFYLFKFMMTARISCVDFMRIVLCPDGLLSDLLFYLSSFQVVPVFLELSRFIWGFLLV